VSLVRSLEVPRNPNSNNYETHLFQRFFGICKKPGLFICDPQNEYAVVSLEKDKNSPLRLPEDSIIIWAIANDYGFCLKFPNSTHIQLSIIENSYKFARQIWLFSKGKIGKLEYRLRATV
jgi:hypothetical protein